MSMHNDINLILFKNDPMKTGCVENDLFDEYVEEAVAIEQLIDDKSKPDIEGVIEIVFDEFFWERCIEKETVSRIADDILKLFTTK